MSFAGSEMFWFLHELFLFGNTMFLLGDDMRPFGNDMCPYGHDMSLFRVDLLLSLFILLAVGQIRSHPSHHSPHHIYCL